MSGRLGARLDSALALIEPHFDNERRDTVSHYKKKAEIPCYYEWTKRVTAFPKHWQPAGGAWCKRSKDATW